MISDNARSGMQQAPARSLFNALGFTAEELKPSCPATGSYDLEELGQMTDKELRHFSYSDVEGVKEYLKNRSQSGPKL